RGGTLTGRLPSGAVPGWPRCSPPTGTPVRGPEVGYGLRGTLSAVPRRGGGFQVAAVLPLTGGAA
ncbi:two-component sensor histidine kinase, partial [Streptomyces sp. NPDC002574]